MGGAGQGRSQLRLRPPRPRLHLSVHSTFPFPYSQPPIMLAPYPNRLRSSRSTPAQSDANSPSASTSPPPPPPSHAFPPSTSTSTAQHRLFSSRSSLPLTRMRTNSLSSSSLPQSDAPSISTGHAPPRPQRNPTRRPILPSRPSTSSGIPDKKQSQVPIVISSPFVGVAPVPVSPLCLLPFTIACSLSSI